MKIRKLFALLMAAVMLLGMMPVAHAELTGCNHDWDSGKWLRGEPSNCQDWKPKTYTCTICGATATNEECGPCVPGSKTWVRPQGSNCQEYGVWEITCKYCGEWLEGREEPGPHKWRETIVEEPWCDVGGMKAMICSVCGEWQGNGTPLAPLGHDWGSWSWAHGEPACNSNGAWQVRECKRCGQMEDRWIQGGSHDMGEWYRNGLPTCTEEGVLRRNCQRCDYYETQPIPKVDHEFGEWYVVTEPEVGVPGLEQRDCTYGCGTYEQREIPALEPAIALEGLELTLTLDSTPANGEYFVVGEQVVFTASWSNLSPFELFPFYVSIWPYEQPSRDSQDLPYSCSFDAEEPITTGMTGSHSMVITVTEEDVARGGIYAMAYIWSSVHNGPEVEEVTTPFVTAPCAPVAGSDYATSIKLEIFDVPSVTAEWAGDVYPVKVKVTNTGDTTVDLCDFTFVDANGNTYLNAILYDWNKYAIDPPCDWLPAGASLTTDLEFAVTQDGIAAGELRFNLVQYASPWYAQVGDQYTDTPADVVPAPEGTTGYYSKTDAVVSDTVEIVVPINQGEDESAADGLTVTKTASAGSYSDPCKPGDEVTFTITVTNNTGEVLTDVEITDPVKGGNEDAIVDIIPSMQPGESVTVSFSYTVTEEDATVGVEGFENTAYASGYTADGTQVSGTSETIFVWCVIEHGLTFFKSIANVPANGVFFVPGETIVFNISMFNHTPYPLYNIILTDPLCQDQYIYDAVNDMSYLYFGELYHEGNVMGESTSATVTVTYVVTEADAEAGSVTNTAEVWYQTWYGKEITDSASATAPCGVGEPMNSAGVRLEKALRNAPANGEYYVPGEVLNYALTLRLDDGLLLDDAAIYDPIAGGDGLVISYGKGLYGGMGMDVFYTVTEEDAQRGYVENTAYATWLYSDSGEAGYCESETVTAICGIGELPEDYEPLSILEVETVATTTPANGSYYVEGETVILVDRFTNRSANLTLTGSDWVNVEILGLGIFNRNADFGADAVLAPGETRALLTSTYVITAEDAAQGYIQKTVHAGFTDENDLFYTGSFEIRIPCAPAAEGLTVTKTASAGSYSDPCKPGDEVTFTITVTNNTGEVLTDVEITDPVKGGNEDAIVDIIPSMQPGESVTVSFNYTVTEEDATVGVEGFENTAYASGYTADGTQVSGTSETIFVWCVIEHGLTFFKSIANVPANGVFFVPGETIVFNISMFNHTPYPLYNIILTDPLCQDQYIYDEINDMSYLYFGELYHEGNVMGESTSATVTVSYVVTEADAEAGSVTNTAEVTYQTWYGKEITDSASATAPCGPADTQPIAVVKGVGNAPADPEGFMLGEVIEFTISVTNNLPETVPHISLVDPLIPDWSYDIYALEPGATASTTVSYTVNILDCFNGSVENYVSGRAVVSDGYRFLTSNTVSADCKEITILHAHPVEDPFGILSGLEVEKTVESLPLNGSFYTEGETVAYRITYTNTGETPLTDVMIYDSLAGMTEIASAETLDVGESRFCVFNYTVTAADVGRGYVSNTAVGQFEIDGYQNMITSETVIVDTDGQTETEIPEGGTSAGSVDLETLHSNPAYCLHASSERTNATYFYSTSFCINHEGTQGSILLMEKAAVTPEMQLQTANYAVALWRSEVEKLYETLLDAADPQARAIIMTEYVSFLTHAANYEAMLNARYADQPAMVAQLMANLWEEKCITLCCDMHSSADVRRDSLLAVPIATMDNYAEACTCVTRNEDKGWNGMGQTFCPTHAFPFAMIDMLLGGQDTAEAWTTVRQIWQVELRSAYNKVIALLGENSDVALAEYATLESWMIAREAELTLLYPDNPELVAQTMVRIVIDQVNALCQLAQ